MTKFVVFFEVRAKFIKYYLDELLSLDTKMNGLTDCES
jgi:hypothetical protein